jgi:uncharacterized protein YndB with AHSA1/START domain
MHQVAREIHVPRPAEEVWEVVADPERLGVWLGGDLELELRPGHRGSFRSPDGRTRRVFVLGVDDGRELSFRWWPDTDAGGASTVTITVDERGEGESTVRVRETRAPALLASA